ncbi:MFS transporter [Streptomyces piniterrae]|uniref:MFS transporter n=1 Tax=Streptomyces piniterrae TaxID=2571125 RepID=A0A4U0NVX4_9ACTN|nr:MFS transporter [Streptomyces piniterrae]TJZ58916.1 MFS transporter [Streptomyces piniterrae]
MSGPGTRTRRRAATVVVCLGLFLLGLDLTVLNVAVPELKQDLSPTMAQVQWIVAAYGLVLGGTVLSTGALTDRIGRRRAYCSGLALCGVTSILGATGHDAGQVIAARGGMGAGAALLMPSTLSIITNLFPETALRRRAIALWAGIGSLGGLAGPVIGGWLVEQFSWHAAFWINVPVAATAILLAWWLVPESRAAAPEPVDVPGALLAAAGLLALVWGIIEGPGLGWTSPPVLAAFAAAAVLNSCFLLWQARCPHPMLPLRFLRDLRISGSALALSLMAFALLGALFVLTLYLQGILGYTPQQAGIRTLPLAGALAAGAVTTLPLLARGGAKVPIVCGLALVTAAFAVLATTETGSGYPRIALFQLIAGFGAGLIAAAGTETVMATIPPDQAGLGSAINDATRQVGSTLGVAVQGSILATVYTTHLNADLAPHHLPPALLHTLTNTPPSSPEALHLAATPAAAHVLSAVRDSFTHAMTTTALTAGTLAFTATAVATYWLVRTRRVRPGHPSLTADAGQQYLAPR